MSHFQPSGNLWENEVQSYRNLWNLWKPKKLYLCHISEVEYQYIKALIKPMTTNSRFGFRGFWVSETWKLLYHFIRFAGHASQRGQKIRFDLVFRTRFQIGVHKFSKFPNPRRIDVMKTSKFC